MMTPHVGTKYNPGGGRSLLLIGESHYLPEASTQHLMATTWYSGDYTSLNPIELSWISTAEIIAKSRADNFKNKAHSIYRRALEEINAYGPKYLDYKMVANDVVYYNYFQRPALKGKSLRVEKQDVEIADERFLELYVQHRPAVVVFLSKLAYRHCDSCRKPGVRVVVTPHPGCWHWYRIAKSYGNRRGREILAQEVQRLWA